MCWQLWSPSAGVPPRRQDSAVRRVTLSSGRPILRLASVSLGPRRHRIQRSCRSGREPSRLMSSCVASCYTCFQKGSCAFGTSDTSPTGDAPRFCHFAFICSAQHRRRSKTHPVAKTQVTFAAAQNVVDRWWSSKGSRPQKSNFVLHHCSPLPHDRTFYNANFCVLQHHHSLSALPFYQSRLSTFSSLLFARVLRFRPFSSLAVVCRALPHSSAPPRHRIFPRLNLHRPRVRRNHGRPRSNGFIECAPERPAHLTAFSRARIR